MEQHTIDILHFEDNPGDAILIREILTEVKSTDCMIRHVDRLSEGLKQLAEGSADIILLDLNLPDSEGLATFEAVKKVAGNVPIIIMSGLADTDLAVKAVQAGAQDYLLKGQVDANLLLRAIRYGIEREKLTVKLRDALDQIKALRGLLPICASCKDIRDDRGYWHQIEDYVRKHSDAEFSHGICPECAEKLYPELYQNKDNAKKMESKKKKKQKF
jgi:DNA-binding NtrC family response regulator